MRTMTWIVLAGICLAGCGDDEPAGNGGDGGSGGASGCTPGETTGCGPATVCEEVAGGTPACFAPLSLEGKVENLVDGKPIAGAHVVARDANGAAVSSVAISGADGTYELVVPAKRDANGVPQKTDVTLRADADGFDTFPAAPRVALPIDLSEATGDPPALANAATDIGLLPLPPGDRGTVSGHVLADDAKGTLVVAGGATGIADLTGAYAVFNVPIGDVEVRGYKAGLALAPEMAKIADGLETKGVDLTSDGPATARVTGKLSIVNAPGGSSTSVILVVEETFEPTLARGEAPPGLRVAGISGDFAFEGVPNGKYAVLAAFENDGLVRDPDTSIAGTDIVHVTVSGKDQALPDPFKITGALAVVAPGASGIDIVSAAPTLSWEDDSSEDLYEVAVYDAFGTLVWEDKNVPSEKGNKNVSVAYAGPALESGMIYQFRATSLKSGVPISRTEDLKGVFQMK